MIKADCRWSRAAPLYRWRFSFGVRSAIGSIAIALLWQLHIWASDDDRGWEFRPYQIKAVVALDVPGGLAEKLAMELPRHLRERVDAAIGPLWSFEAQLAKGVLRQSVLSNLRTGGSTSPGDFSSNGDKLLLLALESKADGFQLTAREFDHYIQRWGPPIRRESRQCEMLAEQMFALARQAVAPLANLEVDPNDPKKIVLHARGGGLFSAGSGEPWARPGDVFLPVLRRTSRGGELAENGIQVVPWTYVEAASIEGSKGVGLIHSGSRRPFGTRRGGRVEQIAVALCADPGETRLYLHSRTNPDKPLTGYELYVQKPGEEATARIGTSDSNGRITVRAGAHPVQTLFVKHGGQLLAKLPVVPGAESEIKVPLPDDDMRLEAEARLAAMREELVDVVARRNILMARARQKIEEKNFEAAQELMRSVDQLPGRSQFNLTLTTASRLLRSDDPQIQRRIDQLFQATQMVLTQYLDARPISELHEELRAAQRKQ
ncbi:MAG TPA: hypothetical protein VGK58_05215 [Lacipirellulaceae bacterium]